MSVHVEGSGGRDSSLTEGMDDVGYGVAVQEGESVILEPAIAQIEGHVEQVGGSEAGELAAQSGGHVGQSERSEGEHVDGSGVNDSSLSEGMDVSVGFD